MIAGERLVEAWFFWIGVTLVSCFALISVAVVLEYTWGKWVGQLRTYVWWRRFTRHWKEFEAWHKQRFGYEAGDEDPYKD